MKKLQIGLLAVLIIFLASFVVICNLQMQKINGTQKEVRALKQEVKELKETSKEKEAEYRKLEEQLQEAENAAAEEALSEDEADAEKTDTEEKVEENTKGTAENGKKVAIDPGHQGPNVDMSAKEPMGPGSGQMKAKATSGTTGRFTGVPEYELNLTISKMLREELESRGYEVWLAREDNDTAISNMERALKAADFGADVYVRIHANGSDSSATKGAMTMVPSANNPYVANLHDKSYALGEAIINEYCAASGIQNNGVQLFDNMTGINWSKVPVTIIEMGFMTNESDDNNMQDPDIQTQMVIGIANGIDRYFEAGN